MEVEEALFTSTQKGSVRASLNTHLLNVVVEATDGKAGVIVILPNPLRVLWGKKLVAVPAPSPGYQGNPRTQSRAQVMLRPVGLTL